MAYANSADPDWTASALGLHCLLLHQEFCKTNAQNTKFGYTTDCLTFKTFITQCFIQCRHEKLDKVIPASCFKENMETVT